LDGSCKIPRSLRTEENQAVNSQWGHIKSQVPGLSFITDAITFGSTVAWGIDFWGNRCIQGFGGTSVHDIFLLQNLRNNLK